MFHDCNKAQTNHLCVCVCVCEMKEEELWWPGSLVLEFACQYSFLYCAQVFSTTTMSDTVFFLSWIPQSSMPGKKWASAPFYPQEGYKMTCNSLLTSMDNIIHLYSLIDLYTWMRRAGRGGGLRWNHSTPLSISHNRGFFSFFSWGYIFFAKFNKK